MLTADLATAEVFRDTLLAFSIEALKFNDFTDNFDAERFPADRARRLNTPARVSFFDWFARRYEELFAAYGSLDDADSRVLFLHLIAFRLASHLCVRLPVSFRDRAQELEAYRATERFVPSALATTATRARLRHYDFTLDGNRYVIDCTGLEEYIFRGQYFYSRGGMRIAPEPGDTVIDGGALLGETALIFSNAVGPQGRVLAFDPVADHLAMLEHNIAQFPFRNVRAMPFGISNLDVDAAPIVLDRFEADFRTFRHEVPLRRLDGLVEAGEIDRIDFLKLDIEGAELAALQGARASIRRFRPKLAISLYHSKDDIFAIILYVKKRFPFYRCHLDHYTIHLEETVLYCTPSETGTSV